jgi:hypothetical protein
MPYDKSPSSFFGAGYLYSSADKKITFSTNNSTDTIKLSELTNTEASTSTGDVRKLVYALILFIEQRVSALGASKPTKMVVKTSIANGSAKASAGGLVKTIAIEFYRSNSSHYDVTPE